MQTIKTINKIFAPVLALLIGLCGIVNSLFTKDCPKWENETSVVGIESLARSQGITNIDGKKYVFSGKTYLEKVDIATGEIEVLKKNAIPEDLQKNYGSAHIGGISYANGIIYASLEDSKVWAHPLVALFDAETLEYTGKFFELPTDKQGRGCPYVIADAEHGVFYCGDSRNHDRELFAYDIETGEYRYTVNLTEDVTKVQGGEYYDGKIYLGTNDAKRACYTVELATGKVEKLFDRISYVPKAIDNFGGEGEDLTVFPKDDGTLVHTLQTGALFIDVSVRDYK